jgi:hypothetical protein
MSVKDIYEKNMKRNSGYLTNWYDILLLAITRNFFDDLCHNYNTIGNKKFLVCRVANWKINSEVIFNQQPLMFSTQNKIPNPFCDFSDSEISSHRKERNTFQLQRSYYKVESSPS